MISLKHKTQNMSISQEEEAMIIQQVISSEALHLVLGWWNSFLLKRYQYLQNLMKIFDLIVFLSGILKDFFNITEIVLNNIV